MPRSELVKFFDARKAAVMPLCAARPGWNGLHMVPNISRSPDDWVAAMPSAHVICCALSLRTRPTAAAAPNTPAVPVMCQPTS